MTASCTPLASVSASQTGALAGYSSTCTCGMEIRSSLRSHAEAEVTAHLSWHQERELGAEKK